MRIFVAGTSGYIGQVVAEQAVVQGHAVTGLARSREDRSAAEDMVRATKARRELGWEPQALGILEDITRGSYRDVAPGLQAQAASAKG